MRNKLFYVQVDACIEFSNGTLNVKVKVKAIRLWDTVYYIVLHITKCLY